MFNFGFAVEQMLVHITHYQNLKHWVNQDRSICSAWMPIEPEKSDIWECLPVVQNNWSLQSSLRAHKLHGLTEERIAVNPARNSN